MLLRHGLSRVGIIGHVQVSRVRVVEWRAEREERRVVRCEV